MNKVKELIVYFWIRLGEVFSFLGDIIEQFGPQIDWESGRGYEHLWRYKFLMFFYDKYADCLQYSLELNDKWKLDIWKRYEDLKDIKDNLNNE